MDYGRIVNRSFEIAWKYKSLWVFGMFAGYGTFNFNLDFPTESFPRMQENPFDILNVPRELWAMFALSVLALVLIFLVISIISKGALIDSINRIERGGQYRFGNAFSAGVDFFLRMLGLVLLELFSALVVVIVITVLIITAFAVHTAIGILSLMVGIPAGIFLLFGAVCIFGLSQRVLVVRNSGIGAALEESYYLVRKNLGKVAVIALITLAFSIGLTILAVIVWMVFALPISAVGLLASMDVITALLVGIAVGLPISLVVGGFMGVFFTSLITLFYFELVEPAKSTAVPNPPAAAPLT